MAHLISEIVVRHGGEWIAAQIKEFLETEILELFHSFIYLYLLKPR